MPDVRTAKRRSGVRIFGVLVAVGLVLSGCAANAQQTTLDPQGPAADKINNLWNLTFGIAAVVFVLVEVGVLWIIWKFRHRNDGDDDEFPEQVHGNTKLEIGWTMLPAVILAFLAVFTVSTVLDLADEPDQALKIRVVGQQWWWSYDYDINGDGVYADNDPVQPGIEARDQYASDIITATEMVIPVNTPVYLDITSRDVIHSYWIPALNGKKDAVPGRTHHLTLEADHEGTFVGQCTEFCGLSHAYMRMTVHAVSQEQYDAWVQQQLKPANEPSTADQAAGKALFEQRCTTCHLIEGVNDDTYNGAAVVSGMAPNLTHFASRGVYAGGIFKLWDDLNGDGIVEFDEIGKQLNRNQLEAWLRNPPGEKPMAPNNSRGMPNLGLSESEIDSLVAYLTSLD